MTKEQLIQIAQVAFPERVKQFIEFDNLEMDNISGVYRLYGPDAVRYYGLIHDPLLIIFIGEEKFIQIQPGKAKAFNHYAAIKEMELMGLV